MSSSTMKKSGTNSNFVARALRLAPSKKKIETKMTQVVFLFRTRPSDRSGDFAENDLTSDRRS
jgi:hypothetical protein